MGTLKMITRERIPCWYELSYQLRNNIPQLLLRINKEYTDQLPGRMIGRDVVIDQLMTEFGFTKWSGTIGENLGFDHALIYLGVVDGFHEYNIPTPKWEKLTGKPCPQCNGTGKDDLIAGDCLYCHFPIPGREVEPDMKGLYAISATLAAILQVMEFPESETSCPFPQLFTVTTMARADGVFELGGRYGLDVATFLCGRGTNTQSPIPEMAAAMIKVWDRMHLAMPEFDRNSMYGYVQSYNGWLNIGCPGDGCGLHPAQFRASENGRGYDFGSHNVDTPMQQLTLLAGLAALHDAVRAEMRAAPFVYHSTA